LNIHREGGQHLAARERHATVDLRGPRRTLPDQGADRDRSASPNQTLARTARLASVGPRSSTEPGQRSDNSGLFRCHTLTGLVTLPATAGV
jgi:hypothetical protein